MKPLSEKYNFKKDSMKTNALKIEAMSIADLNALGQIMGRLIPQHTQIVPNRTEADKCIAIMTAVDAEMKKRIDSLIIYLE